MFHLKTLLISCVVLLFVFNSSQAQNIIKNGSFEEGDEYWKNWAPSGDPMGTWLEVSSRTFDYGIDPTPAGKKFAEVDYETNFEQTVAVEKGASYTIRFALAKRVHSANDRILHLKINGMDVFTKEVNNQTSGRDFRYEELEYTATSNSAILGFHTTFKQGSIGLGVMLDDISMVKVKTIQNFTALIFQQSKTSLVNPSLAILENLLTALKDNPTLRIKIIGHTDNVGSSTENDALALGRAKMVQQYLIDNGIESSRLEVDGKGQNSPAVNNSDPNLRPLNRRVEIEILK